MTYANPDTNKLRTYTECSGCGVCSLVCPVWTQSRDISLTLWGRAKAVQGGANAEDIRDSLEACVSCGACEVVCPEFINAHTTDNTYRSELGMITPDETKLSLQNLAYDFFPTQELQKEREFINKLNRLFAKYSQKNDVITNSPEWQKKLMSTKSAKITMGIGEWLLNKGLLEKHIQENDFYWMDAALFHAKYNELVKKYNTLQIKTNCHFNWNLNRTAMPLGADNAFYKREEQFQWTVFNKNINRVVVENINDWLWLKEKKDFKVFHILEIISENAGV